MMYFPKRFFSPTSGGGSSVQGEKIPYTTPDALSDIYKALGGSLKKLDQFEREKTIYMLNQIARRLEIVSDASVIPEAVKNIASGVKNLQPTGTISIFDNGQYDVASYANADVNIQPAPLPAYVNGFSVENMTGANIQLNNPVHFGYVNNDGITVFGSRTNAIVANVGWVIPNFLIGNGTVKLDLQTSASFNPVPSGDDNLTVEKVSDGLIIRGLEKVDPTKNVGVILK